jgi:predicted N-acetyltransferase YhbS
MNTGPFTFRLEEPGDHSQIESLHRDVFGPGRFARAAYRLREGVRHEAGLSFVAHTDGQLVASVRLTRIEIGGRPALLLGPLVVKPSFKGQGAGKALVRMAVAAAREAGHRIVLLVGDEPYYGPLGFSALEPYAITLPAPVDPNRVLVAGLADGALDGLSGAATPAGGKNS